MYGELAPHLTFHNPTCSWEGDIVWREIFMDAKIWESSLFTLEEIFTVFIFTLAWMR